MNAIILAAFLMVQVTSVKDGRTLIVDGRTEVRLSGVEIVDEFQARELLRWTVAGSWIAIEKQPDGTALVYRSPDALFLNRELVLRGFARATQPGIAPEHRVTGVYQGTVNLGVRPAEPSQPRASSGTPAPRQRSSRTSRRKAAG